MSKVMRNQSVADSSVAVLVAMTTVALGILIDDSFPVGSAVRGPAVWRIVVFLALLGLLMAAVVHRARLVRDRGTMFYVELLQAGSRNLHTRSVQAAAEQRLDYQQITATINPPVGSGRMWDGRAEVADLVRRITDATNSDNSRTGTELAPNLLWPFAVAFGYLWRPPPKVRAIELSDRESEVAIDAVVESARKAAEQLRADSSRVPFVAGIGCHVMWERAASARPPTAIWVYATLSPPAEAPGTAQPTSVRVGPGAPLPIDRFVVIGAVDSSNRTVAVEFDQDGEARVGDDIVTAADFAALVAAQLLSFRVLYPDAVVLLSARLAKSLAIAVGVGLDELVNEYYTVGPRQSREAIWNRIVLLHWPDGGDEYVATWVLRDQADPASVLAGILPSTPGQP